MNLSARRASAALAGLALAALLVAPLARAQDPKPGAPAPAAPAATDKPTLVSVAVTTKVLDAATAEQEAEFQLENQLLTFGFATDGKVATKWDGYLAKHYKGLATVPPKDGQKKPDDKKPEEKKPDPDLQIEGSIDLHYRPTTFMGKTQAHNYLATVSAVLKDAKGAVLETVKFQHYAGRTVQNSQEEVEKLVESQAFRFLIVKLFKLDEISSKVPAAKQQAFKKFVDDEDKYMGENYVAPPKNIADGKDGK